MVVVTRVNAMAIHGKEPAGDVNNNVAVVQTMKRGAAADVAPPPTLRPEDDLLLLLLQRCSMLVISFQLGTLE